jgi:hypothetical protein
MSFTGCVLALFVVLAEVTAVFSWDFGDIVPVTAFIRVNGKLLDQAGTPLPISNCPRFGSNRIVQLPALFATLFPDGHDDIHQASEDAGSRPAPNIAIRFEVGRGLNKNTKWITVRQSANQSRKAPQQRSELHLTMIRFEFGYQMGVFNRLTSFKAFATHSDRPHESITLKFDWDEHRQFNPHRALSVVSFVCLALGITLMLRITHSAYGGAFRTKNVVVHDRSD